MENNGSENPGKHLDAYWDDLRDKNFDHSFPEISRWIREVDNRTAKLQSKTRRQRRRLARLIVVVLPIFFTISCTIHVKRVENSGSLVNFSIDKQKNTSFQKLSFLHTTFAVSYYAFLQPDQPHAVSFIFFIRNTEQQKLQSITHQLKLLDGLIKLDIAPVNCTISESLFSTFLHKTLNVGKAETLTSKELVTNIRATLKTKGLDFLSTDISNDDGDISFASPPADSVINIPFIQSGSSTVSDTAFYNNPKSQNSKTYGSASKLEKLQMFNWLLGSWRVKYVPVETYHQWLRISDSLLMCFIVKYDEDDPDISVGFSIRYSNADSAILSLRDIKWEFVSANNQEVNFRNEVTPKSANVKWALGNERASWQSVISGEKNLEIVNLVRDEEVNLETVVRDFIGRHPEITTEHKSN